MEHATHILIVDDEESILDFLGQTLTDEGYRVSTAINGAAALEQVAADPPDLILLDLRMPVMDGSEFLRAYRDALLAPIPIVIITAARTPMTVEDGYHIVAVVEKPFELDELLDRIRDYVKPTLPGV